MMDALKKEILDRFDPDNQYLKQALRTAFATLLALLIYHYQTHWTQAYWLVLASAFLMQTRLGHTQKQQVITLLICTVSAALLAYFAALLSQQPFFLAFYLAITTFVAVYVSILGFHIAVAAFFINLYAIMSGGLAVDKALALERADMIVLGGLFAFIMCWLWPTRLKQTWYKSFSVYLFSLAEFCERLNDNYLNEKRLHERRNRLTRQFNQLRLAQSHFSATHEELTKKIEHLYDGVIALGNVRHHSKDIFQTALYPDMSAIHHHIALCLRALAKYPQQFSTQYLDSALETLLKKIESEKPPQEALLAFYHAASYLEKHMQNLSVEMKKIKE